MRLIINADDFGMSMGINYGIIDAYRLGVVRSATLMANMPHAKHAAELVAENKGLGVGVHLTLTAGKPLTDCKTLVTPDGLFLKQGELRKRQSELDLAEVRREYTAQIVRVLSLGIKPTHLDGHHHTHLLPAVLEVTAEVAKSYGLPVRLNEKLDGISSVDKFIVGFYGENTGTDSLIDILKEYSKTKLTVEVMCHPAYIDSYLLQSSAYNLPRARELSTLTNPEVLRFINENGIELINYRELNA